MSHSSAFRDRNIILFVVLSFELAVGGERMLMSRAVPLRKGTIGVSSNATRGCCVIDEARESGASDMVSLAWSFAPEWAADISNASINPGDITIEHSSG